MTRLYVMYHATDKPENVESILRYGFRRSSHAKNMLGEGVYVSRQEAKTTNYGRFCFKLIVYTGKTRVITYQGDIWQKSWQDSYNSAWVPPNCGMVHSGLEENCINNPTHIRIVGIARGYNQLPRHIQTMTYDCSSDIAGIGDREEAVAQNLCHQLGRDYDGNILSGDLTGQYARNIPDFEFES